MLCSGSLRIARADFDTNPPEAFQAEVFEWMVTTLNAVLATEQAKYEAALCAQPADTEAYVQSVVKLVVEAQQVYLLQ